MVNFEMPNFMRSMLSSLLLLAALAVAVPASAQDVPGGASSQAAGSERSMDVRAGDLDPKLAAGEGDQANRFGSYEVSERNEAQVDALFEEMIASFRSACCPHQEMADVNCPCHAYQALMLRFLVTRGFSAKVVHDLMVQGVNASTFPEQEDAVEQLEREYLNWLPRQQEYQNWKRERFGDQVGAWSEEGMGDAQIDRMLMERFLEIKWNLRQKEEVMLGFRHGWTKLIEEAPRNQWLYAVLAGAGLVVVVVFVLAIRLMLRSGKAQAGEQADKADSADGDSTAAARDQVERELEDMDDED